MSSGLSQIPFWRKGGIVNNNANSALGGPGAMYLSYDVFLGLSVLGGFLALDHLYLRSPLTFLAKLILNGMTFGAWWLYDATQAIFNKDVVKVYGLGIPGMGPQGIAAGVLASDVPDKKHMSFFFYALALMVGGLFGLDSFILGDKRSGFIRLICVFTVIFAPIAMVWWLYNLGKFLFNTKSVVEANYEYFGAPSTPGVMDSLFGKIPFLSSLFGLFDGSFFSNLLRPFTNTADAAIGLAQSGVNTVKSGIDLGKEALKTGSEVIQTTGQIVGETAQAASTAFSVLPPGTQLLSSTLTPQSVEAAKINLMGKTTAAAGNALQTGGGGSSDLLSGVLIGTLGLIAVSGFILTYRRSRQNGQPRKDDSPPEPGVLRESDKKEPIAVT
jgi:hypothetical protein